MHKSASTGPGQASPGNPCPFLRALEAGRYIKSKAEPVLRIGRLIAKAAGAEGAAAAPIAAASVAIAAFANGPLLVARNLASGFNVSDLRKGPLDKRGAGSRILDQHSSFDAAEFSRLEQFAEDLPQPHGGSERGLTLAGLKSLMDANFARAKGHRRAIDRALMDGEWPPLLKVLKKGDGATAYLSLNELRTLFAERKLPDRVTARIAAFRQT